MGKLTYPRGTTYAITENYTGPNPGVTAILTAKTVAFDADDTDTTNAIFTPKTLSMTGSNPETVTFVIDPTDVSPSQAPGSYFYSIKVIDSIGAEYIVASDKFVLTATTTNETS